MKKQRFGAGKWNGFGGKVDPPETIEEAAGRELLEEAGLTVDPTKLQKVAVLEFYFADKSIFECHAFIAREWQGEPQETDEMAPAWFALDQIPYDSMWSSDAYWLPRVLAGETLRGTCRFNGDGTAIERFDLVPAQL